MLSGFIRERLKTVPFEPFVIQMTDGRQFKVPLSDFATVSPKGSYIVVFREDNDADVRLNALLVASVEVLHSTPNPA